jgi:[citrate (pro-3S)-lyase] ligase
MAYDSLIFEKNFDMEMDAGVKRNNFNILKKIEKYINQRGGQMIVLEMPSIIDIKNKNFFEQVNSKLCSDSVYKSYGKNVFDGEVFFDDFRKSDFEKLVNSNVDLYKNCFDNYSQEYVHNISIADSELIQSDSFFLMENCKSKAMNTENGIRLEKNAEDKENNIFLFGASNAFGYYVYDDETISSYMRQYDLGNYNIYNCATIGDTMINIYNRIINFDIEKNDIVIVGVHPVILNRNFDLFSTIRTMNYFEQPHDKENFVDMSHYTAFCHRNLAKIIYESIKGLLTLNKGFEIEDSKSKKVIEAFNNYKLIVKQKGWKLKKSDEIGIAVMSANPFTIGHRHLVELGSKMFDYFVIFLMQDGYDLIFDKKECQKIVEVGVSDLDNVIVAPFPEGCITWDDFCPEYNNVAARHAKNFIGINVYDLANMLVVMCKEGNFSHYIAGIETDDAVTRQMCLHFKNICELNGINFIAIPRKKIGDNEKSISGTECRKLLETKQYDKLLKVLQPNVLQYIIDNNLATKKREDKKSANRILEIYEANKEKNTSKYLNMIGVDKTQYSNIINETIEYVNAMNIVKKDKNTGLELLFDLYNKNNNMSAWAGYQYIMNSNDYTNKMVEYVLGKIKDSEHQKNILTKVHK